MNQSLIMELLVAVMETTPIKDSNYHLEVLTQPIKGKPKIHWTIIRTDETTYTLDETMANQQWTNLSLVSLLAFLINKRLVILSIMHKAINPLAHKDVISFKDGISEYPKESDKDIMVTKTLPAYKYWLLNQEVSSVVFTERLNSLILQIVPSLIEVNYDIMGYLS